MCTLTIFPLEPSGFVLTTNRDEQPERKTLPPKEYIYNHTKLIFPKDQRAGGTWVGANNNGRVASLMNGGKKPHIRKSSYRLSRGIVLTELLKVENAFDFLKKFDFIGIEPFTIIMIEPKKKASIGKFKAYEIVWDEHKLHIKALPWKAQIWSSTPLYTRNVHQNRIKWLNPLYKRKPAYYA